MFTRYGKATLDEKTLDELRRLARLLADDLVVHMRGLAGIAADAARIAACSRQLQRRLEEVAPDTAELPTITTHEDDTHEAAGPPSPAAGPALGHTSAA